MRTYRAIVWAEDQIPNTDPRDSDALPAIIVRSRETFFIQTSRPEKAISAFKRDIKRLAETHAHP